VFRRRNPIIKNEITGSQMWFFLRSLIIATHKTKQLIALARKTAPPIVPEAWQDIFNELKANHMANTIMETCNAIPTLTREKFSVLFITLASNVYPH